MTAVFGSVAVANRGEIAVRITRTLRRLGIRSVALHTDADRGAPHVVAADVAVRIGSYLDVDEVVAASVAAGAEALHPGYGFLSENAALAAACAASGITFVGPPVRAIEVMGDKINAKDAVAAAGVPVVPGRSGADLSDEELAAAAVEVGLPVLLKPSAGGGGKGMRRVDEPGHLPAEIAAARREAVAAFGDGTLLVERWVSRPRHIEIQVLADTHGHCLHLGERECSLQRRHQKVVEEAPSVLLNDATRAAMGAAAVAAARSVGYTGAGTVELIVSAERPGEFFFMEMNTRLQVEHPVTEAVTGLDLVEWQLRVAAGEPLGFAQGDVRVEGHAVEARVYAEDPARGFLPAAGRVLALREPSGRPGVRVDSGIAAGSEVGTSYDPMLAKVIARGRDRAEALARLDAALASTAVLGVRTNVEFLRRLLAHPDVVAGRLDTELIDRTGASLAGEAAAPGSAVAVAALAVLLAREAPGPWGRVDGWRVGAPAETVLSLSAGGAEGVVAVRVTGGPEDCVVGVGGGAPVAMAARLSGAPAAGAVGADRGSVVGALPVGLFAGGRELEVTEGGVTTRWLVASAGATIWVGAGGAAWPVTWVGRHDPGAAAAAGAAGPVTSPMPGTVLAVHVAVGDLVDAGQPLVTVEAMKMEYAVTAPAAGVVAAVHVVAGQSVALGQPLAEVTVAEAER